MDRLDKEQARWFALRTQNRREKMAAKLLAREGVEHYLPLQPVTRRYERKVVKRKICLLPCYVFVKIVKAEEQKIYDNPYANFLRVGGSRLDIPQSDIDLMRHITGESDLQWDVAREAEWMEGDEVELMGGIFTGLRGKYVRKKNKNLFVVTISSLNLHGDGYLQAEVNSRYVIKSLGKN